VPCPGASPTSPPVRAGEYGNTKLANRHFAQGLHRQLERAGTVREGGGGFLGTFGPPVRKPLVRPGTSAAVRTLWEVSRRETGLDVDVADALRSG
jgi:hypothetical protein